MTDLGTGTDSDSDSDDDLRRFAARAEAEEAVRRIGQEAWLRLRTEESGHLGGLLVDLAERSDQVTLSLTTGMRRSGRIEALGSNLVALRLTGGELCLLSRSAITAIRLPPGGPALVGDRPVGDAVDRLDLRSALDRLVAEQPTVRVTVDGSPDPVPGTLTRLGVDLLMVSCPDGSTVHIPLTAVVEVHLTDSRGPATCGDGPFPDRLRWAPCHPSSYDGTAPSRSVRPPGRPSPVVPRR